MAPTLILLHGFTHTGGSWAPVIAALGERYRALAPDIRGHGASADRRPVTLDAVIGDIEALAPASRCTLAGYSMGGRIALHAALSMADRVQRLVLIGASPGIADPAERDARRAADEQLAEEIERTSIDDFARQWAATPVLTGQAPEVVAAAHADRLRSSPVGLARALRGLGTGALPSLWDRLGELQIPVTLIVGGRDEKFRAVATRMARAIPDGEVAVVPGAGHAVHLEEPERVAALIEGGESLGGRGSKG
jgi:2-succinyl-6-hydroxy-2,4-cyclohexadiene-1-carboxylate synthase